MKPQASTRLAITSAPLPHVSADARINSLCREAAQRLPQIVGHRDGENACLHSVSGALLLLLAYLIWRSVCVCVRACVRACVCVCVRARVYAFARAYMHTSSQKSLSLSFSLAEWAHVCMCVCHLHSAYYKCAPPMTSRHELLVGGSTSSIPRVPSPSGPNSRSCPRSFHCL